MFFVCKLSVRGWKNLFVRLVRVVISSFRRFVIFRLLLLLLIDGLDLGGFLVFRKGVFFFYRKGYCCFFSDLKWINRESVISIICRC